MKTAYIRQVGNLFQIKKETTNIKDFYSIQEYFHKPDEVCEYLKEHGEVAETTNIINFTLNNTDCFLEISQNFDDQTYENLEFVLMQVC